MVCYNAWYMQSTTVADTPKAILAQAGLRITRQREIILTIIQHLDGHPDADEVYGVAKKALPRINLSTVYRTLQTLKERRDATVDILNAFEGVHCYRPNATFYLFPNVTGLMEKKNLTNYEAFRKAMLMETGVSVCTRLHFGRALEGEKDFYVRLAYSGIDTGEIKQGLGKLKVWAEN